MKENESGFFSEHSVHAPNSKTKKLRKPQIWVNILVTGVMNMPIFSSKVRARVVIGVTQL